MAAIFQPINTPERYELAVQHITELGVALGELVLGRVLPVDTVTIFCHSDEEYEVLEPLIRSYGVESDFTHGKTLYIENQKLVIPGQQIKYLGLRQPEADRVELGYVDYPVDDFADFQVKSKTSVHLRAMQSGRGQNLIELMHPDFDIRGYIVAANEH